MSILGLNTVRISLVIAIACSQSIPIIAQDDVLPFPANGKWIFESGSNNEWGYNQSDPIIRTIVDTVEIGGVEYFDLGSVQTCDLQDWNTNGTFVREDSGKWYSFSDQFGELLYCDFTLKVNDTIDLLNTYLAEQEPWKVIELTNIDIGDNIQRRKWILHPLSIEEGLNWWDEIWIEGIGNLQQFGTHVIPGVFDHGWFNLVCFGSQSEDIYPLNNLSACCWIGGLDELNSSLTISPNPAVDQIRISIENNIALRRLSWEIRSLTSQKFECTEKISTEKEVILDISNLNNGIYLVIGVDGHGNSIQNKIVVMND